MISKCWKWIASFARVAVAKFRLGNRLELPASGKPIYLGRGVRLQVQPNGKLVLGSGCYFDDYSRIQVSANATLKCRNHVYCNTNVRINANESITIGDHTMIGPNVCIFDHDHVFDSEGVHADLTSSPISIGNRCWIAANSVVTRGVSLCDGILIGGAVVTRSLEIPGVYAGMPCRMVHQILHEDGVTHVEHSAQTQDGNHSAQDSQWNLSASHLQTSSKRS